MKYLDGKRPIKISINLNSIGLCFEPRVQQINNLNFI